MIYQLRRIGLPPSIEKIKNLYRVNNDTTMIGRGHSADIFLDSNIRKGLISRAHAQIIRKENYDDDIYEIFDTSLNGTYVNHVKIKGSVLLKDGDVIAFGHLRGSLIEPGTLAPQKESEFLFKFEKNKHPEVKEENIEVNLIGEENLKQKKSSVFMSPNSPNNNNNTYLFEDSPLPGVLPQLNVKSPLSETKKPLKRKRSDEDNELKDIIKNIVKYDNADSEDVESSFNLLETPLLNEDSKQPKLISEDLLKVESPSSSSISSSTNDIKIDTSINVKHVAHSKQNGIAKVKDKVEDIFNDHENDTKIKFDDDSLILSEIRKYDINNDHDDSLSEKSEEVTDDSEDSDFSLSDFKSPKKPKGTKRTLKAPEKFSPASDKELENNVNTKSLRTNHRRTKKPFVSSNLAMMDLLHEDNNKEEEEDDDNGLLEENYEHDKCESVDCKRPANALKKITWVQCDDCDKWYHVSCSGLSTKAARNKNTIFHCGC